MVNIRESVMYRNSWLGMEYPVGLRTLRMIDGSGGRRDLWYKNALPAA